MTKRVLRNIVLYMETESSTRRYKQIGVLEGQNYEVRVFEGEVLQEDPQFLAGCSDAEVSFLPSLRAALQEAESLRDQMMKEGWTLYPS
jgi:hypothetical protein